MTAIKTINGPLLILLSALLFSCDQAPIFYNISNETAPEESLIPGVPGSFAIVGSVLYTSNGASLWAFSGTNWVQQAVTGIPEGQYIKEVISDGTNLYIRTEWDTGTVNLTTHNAVYRLDGSLVASALTNSLEATHPLINRISVANGTLFASVNRRDVEGGFRHVYFNGSTLTAFGGTADLPKNSAILAAAYSGGMYFFATGRGVFHVNSIGPELTLLGTTSGAAIAGLRAFGNEVLAWSRDETVYRIDADTLSAVAIGTGLELENASAFFDYGTVNAFLVGHHYSQTNNGYREIILAGGALPASLSFAAPGEAADSTTIDEAQYNSSMGRFHTYAIQHWMEGSDSILFAGTEAGLYYSVNRGPWRVWSNSSHSEFN